MKKKKLRFGEGFRVMRGNRVSQAAEMVLAPGDAEGGADNRRHKLAAGSLVFIQRREKHQVKNTGRGLLRTLNFYVPPAYKTNGDPLPRGRK
jgi:oxalate decarboxylase/phosphoglucose isomerase-like protein (cupin superfamily)